MRLIFAGTGSAFCLDNYQTNTLIERNGKYLLIDCGGDIRFSLRDLKLSYKNIDAIYITHQHSDHCSGLEYMAFCSYFDPTVKEKINLIGNNELIRELWNTSLKGGLRSIQGKRTTLEDYFDLSMIKKNGKFYWEDIEFKIVQSIHVMDEYSIVPSYGLIFVDPDTNKTIYYTSDTQFCPNQIMDFYKQADLIIQDCETSPFSSGVHANYKDLKTLPSEIKSKMILQHYQDNVVKANEFSGKVVNDGFSKLGFVPKGYVLDTVEWWK